MKSELVIAFLIAVPSIALQSSKSKQNEFSAAPPTAQELYETTQSEEAPEGCTWGSSDSYNTFQNVPAHLVFVKMHKVGGTAFQAGLVWKSEWLKKDTLSTPSVECGTHCSSLPLMDLLRQRSVLEAPNEKRVRAMRKLADSKGALEKCPLPDDGRPLYTLTVLRDPVERLVSKYFYEQGIDFCEKVRNTSAPCSSDVMDIVEWANASTMYAKWDTAASKWGPGPTKAWGVACEPIYVLGGSDCSAEGLKLARQTMKAIDVVAITEYMYASARLTEHKLGLKKNSLEIEHDNTNHAKPPISQETCDALAQLPAVKRDTELYKEALSRFRSELSAAGLKVPEFAGIPLVCNRKL